MKGNLNNINNERDIIPVILAGGRGSRLWPLSRESYPKQFLRLNEKNNFTLLQNTYLRLIGLNKLTNPIIISNQSQRFLVAEQMREIGVKPHSILLEPFGRGTCAPIIISALKALEKFSDKKIDPILLILSADHQIRDISKFHLAIRNSIEIALRGDLVIFGVTPTLSLIHI